MDKFKIGIIGCGGIANGKHMPSLAKQPDAEMVAFCDIIEERAVSAAKKYGIPGAKVYTDYKKLLEDKSIDIVHVLTPNKAHSPITCDALEAGKHVMCEKPMAISSAEAQKMVDAAKRTGKKLTIGYQNRQNPSSQYLKAEAVKGTFGEIYYAEAIAVRRRAVPTWGVFLDEEAQGGGPLIDIGTHALDLTLWVSDNYKPKYCVGTTYHKMNNMTETGNAWGDWDPKKFTVEDAAFGFVVMENGATINLKATWAINLLDGKEACITIAGTKAGADMPSTEEVRINGVANNRQYTLEPSLTAKGVAFYDGEKDNPSEKECRAWLDSIKNNTAPYVLPEQAFVVSQILEGIYISAKSGKPHYFK